APKKGLRAASQPQAEARAATRGVLDTDRAAVRFGDVFHDRQAEARARQRARVARAPETVEHTRRILGRDTRPVVPDAHLAAVHGDLDDATRGTPFAGVVEQIRDGARYARADAAHGRLFEDGFEANLRVT